MVLDRVSDFPRAANRAPSALVPGYERTTTDDLLARVACGDQAAFAALYDATVAQVFGLVHAIVGDVVRSEQITAKVYRRLWRTAARYDPARGHAKEWLLATARCQALDGVRTPGAAHWRATRLWHRRHGASVGEVATEALSRLGGTQLRTELDGLGDQARDVLVMIYYRGYTTRALARALGIAQATAHSELSAALRTLRQITAFP
ncbi:MAG: sigma factor [Sciscionella sp.]